MTEKAPSQNPFGLKTVTPYLVIRDVKETVQFAQTIFNAELRGDLQMREDGSVAHAEIAIGDSVIMMGEKTDQVDWMPGMLYVYVEDCDATYQKAIELGAEPVIEPTLYPHGDRYGGFKDSCGNVWWAVTHVGSN